MTLLAKLTAASSAVLVALTIACSSQPLRAQPETPAPEAGSAAAGRLHEKDLPEVYGQALRYFEPKLSEDLALQLARCLIDASRAAAIDARLAVAVLADEGSLRKARLEAGEARVGSVPARKAMDDLGRDLSSR